MAAGSRQVIENSGNGNGKLKRSNLDAHVY